MSTKTNCIHYSKKGKIMVYGVWRIILYFHLTWWYCELFVNSKLCFIVGRLLLYMRNETLLNFELLLLNIFFMLGHENKFLLRFCRCSTFWQFSFYVDGRFHVKQNVSTWIKKKQLKLIRPNTSLLLPSTFSFIYLVHREFFLCI